MKRLVIGILAHVDSGKTTLSEGILYSCGAIRKIGRVDKRDTFLDNNEMERKRGITIFSKQAVFNLSKDCSVTLLDTPGHVDFSAEMERTLQVLDYAVLVISGTNGVQAHTRTLWKLLLKYKIPVFIFVNKMDQPGAVKDEIMCNLRSALSDNCVDFSDDNKDFYEHVAMCDDSLLDTYLENNHIEDETINSMIAERKIFPCCFGSALKMLGIDYLLKIIEKHMSFPKYPDEFRGRVYKIGRDDSNNRLTYMKVTGGHLKVRDCITGSDEKVNQIRVYSGEKFTSVPEAEAGMVVAVTGLSDTLAGDGVGAENGVIKAIIEPVLNYSLVLPAQNDAMAILEKLRKLEEEEPQLHIVWNEKYQQIQAQIMGEVQVEILENEIKNRFGIDITFGQGKILYKETIAEKVEGVGHFEPLRHYAEVHLILEPGETGTRVEADSICSEDVLSKNWQRLILTHINEREHTGVLTGSPLTDVKITVASGKAHNKHTEGGDFRQATYRAIRQGLMKAESVLLEPFYEFVLEVPSECTGRAMTDIERMCGCSTIEKQDDKISIISGSAPVSTMRNYQKEVAAYTKGLGHINCNLKGYFPCHNTDEVVKEIGYVPERDTFNPCGSVFCAHGCRFNVEWNQVEEYMHMPSVFSEENPDELKLIEPNNRRTVSDEWIGTEEIDEILRQTYYSNSGKNSSFKKVKTDMSSVVRNYRGENRPQERLILVDGYNVIFAWKELNELAAVNIDSSRGMLLDRLCNYQGMKGDNVIVVFDSYRVKGRGTIEDPYNNIRIVFTKENEAADQYIERFVHENNKKLCITVVTSDGAIQNVTRGAGALVISSREFEQEVIRVEEMIREKILKKL